MKKKLSKILGVGLALVMVLSLAFALMPVNQAQAAEGNMQWLAVTADLPDGTGDVMVNGSDVTDIAVAGDGKTIYAINGAVNMNVTAATPAPPWALYKSTNAGQSFTEIILTAANAPGASANPLGCVAVAPDDPNYAAISVRIPAAVDVVFITTNGGVTRTQLPAFAAPANTVDTDVMDLAVGPARAAALYGRDYMAALADETTAITTDADVQIIGGGANWASIGGVGITLAAATEGRYDYMACAFSPYYAGDRSVAVIGADNSATGTGVHLQIIDVRATSETRNSVLNANVGDWDILANTAGTNIFAADITLPNDWDPTAAAGQRTWCSTASGTAGNDSVYRVDATTVWDLSVGVTNVQWQSVAYSGTIDEGKLFAGAYAFTAATVTTNVSYAADPQLVQPTWKRATTPPTGDTGRAVARVAPDFGETGKVFVGTTGANESAFSVSYNEGVSYQQEALIDNGTAFDNVRTIDDIALTPDGGTIFMATDDGTELSLWKGGAAPDGPTFYGWSRIYCVTAAGPGLVALSPGYGVDDETLIFTDTVAGGRMYVSANGGDTYARRFAASLAAAVAAVAMQDADVVYIGQGSNVYKSADSCKSFGPPSQLGLGAITGGAMDASVPGVLLVGCAGGVYYSTDEGGSFIPTTTGLAGNVYTVCPDEGYADNGYVYAASTAANDSLFRFEIGVSSAWDNLIVGPAVAAPIIGVAMNNGALYAMTAGQCSRTLGPHDAPGTITWRYMTVGASGGMALFSVTGNHLYAADTTVGTPAMDAYSDYLATTAPVLTGPKDGVTIAIDPVTGRGEDIIFAWDAMGTGTGLVNNYNLLIWEKAKGITAAGIYSAAAAATNMGFPEGPQVAASLLWDAPAAAAQPFIPLGGVEYEWVVRAFQEVSGDTIVSPLSDVSSFKVEVSTGIITPEYEGPILQAPIPGGVAIALTPGFSWVPIPDTAKYEFELSTSAATTARGYFIDALVGKTGDNALATAGWQCDVVLDYDTSYFWHVKAINADGGESVWGTAQFTTISEAAVPVPPAPPVELPAPVTPAWIWAIVAIGAVLVIVVIVLIVVTRRP